MGDILFAIIFFIFGFLWIIHPKEMIKLQSGLKKDAKIKIEWYFVLIIRICGVVFILLGLILIIFI